MKPHTWTIILCAASTVTLLAPLPALSQQLPGPIPTRNFHVHQPHAQTQTAYYIVLPGDKTDPLFLDVFHSVASPGSVTSVTITYSIGADETTVKFLGSFPTLCCGDVKGEPSYHFGWGIGPAFTQEEYDALETGWEFTDMSEVRIRNPSISVLDVTYGTNGITIVRLRNTSPTVVNIDILASLNTEAVASLPSLNPTNFPISAFDALATGFSVPASATGTFTLTAGTTMTTMGGTSFPAVTGRGVIYVETQYLAGFPHAGKVGSWFAVNTLSTLPLLPTSLLVALSGVLASIGFWRQRQRTRASLRGTL